MKNFPTAISNSVKSIQMQFNDFTKPIENASGKNGIGKVFQQKNSVDLSDVLLFYCINQIKSFDHYRLIADNPDLEKENQYSANARCEQIIDSLCSLYAKVCHTDQELADFIELTITRRYPLLCKEMILSNHQNMLA